MKTFLILVGLLLALAACGAKQADVVMWQTMDPHENDTFKEVLEAFKTAHPDISVDVQLVPFNDAREKYMKAAQAGSPPDVLRCEIAWTPLYADLGFLAELEEKIPAEDLADYLAAPLNYNKFAGHLWGIPQVTDCLALVYNKRLLAEAGVKVPGTMDELLEAAKKLTDPAKDRYGIYIPADSYFLQPFIWAFGGNLISNDKKIQIAEEGAVKGLEFFLQIRNAAMPKEVNFATMNKERDEGFKSGRYAMLFQGPWASSDLLSGPEFKDNPDNFGVAVIPKGPAGYGSPVGGHNYIVSKKARDIAKAVTFIQFANRTESQILFAVKNNLLPTRRSAYADPKIMASPVLQGFKAQLEVARNRPVIPEGGGIYPSFTRNVQEVFSGNMSARRALEQTAADWQKELFNK
jgi:arabinogalactan oligomer/maltooligosaccharide transport system substrate-binding protein